MTRSATFHLSEPSGWSRRAALRLGAAGALGAWAVGGCEPPRPPLRVGTNVWPGYEPLYVARERGALPESIRLVELLNASQVLHGLRLGLLDVGALTLDEALRLHAELSDLRVLLVMDISHGGDGVVGGPAVPRLADLAGRRVGVEDSALGLYVLTRAAELGGVPYDALLPVHLPVHAHADAFRRGEVDAVVTFDPTLSILVAEGGHRLLGSEALPGEIVDVLVVREGTRLGRAAELRELVAAWYAAVALVQRGPEGGRAPFTARLGAQLPPDAPVYAGLRFPAEHEQSVLVDPAVGELPGALRRLSTVLSRLGHLPEGFDGAGLLDAAAP